MKRLLVLVKQVPVTENVKMDPETGTMIRTGIETIVNPLDLYAVEEAVRLKEATDEDVRVCALSMGPPGAAETIREAIAMGCDDGVLLTGREFAGSDTWATAYALAKGIEHLGGFDLILCGERATDGETGQVGPMVGTLLGLPVVTYVSRIARTEADAVIAHRAIEGGHEVIRCSLPALACVVKEINEPRLPTLKGKVTARRSEIEVLNAEAIEANGDCLGLGGSPTRVVKVFYPTLTRSGVIVSTEEESVEECVDRLIDFLRTRELV